MSDQTSDRDKRAEASRIRRDSNATVPSGLGASNGTPQGELKQPKPQRKEKDKEALAASKALDKQTQAEPNLDSRPEGPALDTEGELSASGTDGSLENSLDTTDFTNEDFLKYLDKAEPVARAELLKRKAEILEEFKKVRERRAALSELSKPKDLAPNAQPQTPPKKPRKKLAASAVVALPPKHQLIMAPSRLGKALGLSFSSFTAKAKAGMQKVGESFERHKASSEEFRKKKTAKTKTKANHGNPYTGTNGDSLLMDAQSNSESASEHEDECNFLQDSAIQSNMPLVISPLHNSTALISPNGNVAPVQPEKKTKRISNIQLPDAEQGARGGLPSFPPDALSMQRISRYDDELGLKIASSMFKIISEEKPLTGADAYVIDNLNKTNPDFRDMANEVIGALPKVLSNYKDLVSEAKQLHRVSRQELEEAKKLNQASMIASNEMREAFERIYHGHTKLEETQELHSEQFGYIKSSLDKTEKDHEDIAEVVSLNTLSMDSINTRVNEVCEDAWGDAFTRPPKDTMVPLFMIPVVKKDAQADLEAGLAQLGPIILANAVPIIEKKIKPLAKKWIGSLVADQVPGLLAQKVPELVEKEVTKYHDGYWTEQGPREKELTSGRAGYVSEGYKARPRQDVKSEPRALGNMSALRQRALEVSESAKGKKHRGCPNEERTPAEYSTDSSEPDEPHVVRHKPRPKPRKSKSSHDTYQKDSKSKVSASGPPKQAPMTKDAATQSDPDDSTSYETANERPAPVKRGVDGEYTTIYETAENGDIKTIYQKVDESILIQGYMTPLIDFSKTNVVNGQAKRNKIYLWDGSILGTRNMDKMVEEYNKQLEKGAQPAQIPSGKPLKAPRSPVLGGGDREFVRPGTMPLAPAALPIHVFGRALLPIQKRNEEGEFIHTPEPKGKPSPPSRIVFNGEGDLEIFLRTMDMYCSVKPWSSSVRDVALIEQLTQGVGEVVMRNSHYVPGDYENTKKVLRNLYKNDENCRKEAAAFANAKMKTGEPHAVLMSRLLSLFNSWQPLTLNDQRERTVKQKWVEIIPVAHAQKIMNLDGTAEFCAQELDRLMGWFRHNDSLGSTAEAGLNPVENINADIYAPAPIMASYDQNEGGYRDTGSYRGGRGSDNKGGYNNSNNRNWRDRSNKDNAQGAGKKTERSKWPTCPKCGLKSHGPDRDCWKSQIEEKVTAALRLEYEKKDKELDERHKASEKAMENRFEKRIAKLYEVSRQGRTSNL
jgi:hypothetical protein